MSRKTDPKKLERVLDAASDLFLSEGYDAASMQQLADKLGLHKSSLYHYVDGKEDLLEQLTRSAQDKAEADLAAAESDPDNGFLAALSLAIDQTLNDVGRTSLVLRQKPGTTTGDAVVERRRAYDRRLSKLIEAAQQSGKMRSDIHPMLLARLTMGMVSWLVEWYDPALSRFGPEEIREAALALVTSGVIVPEDD
ncbi:MAG: TetR/AcrR family transcriptional regulator [Alphaproteobacteria bacterium]|nr:MAG: TetR/AcrR family transcriptional regulator [Alphaproteobacteria bacterium]